MCAGVCVSFFVSVYLNLYICRYLTFIWYSLVLAILFTTTINIVAYIVIKVWDKTDSCCLHVLMIGICLCSHHLCKLEGNITFCVCGSAFLLYRRCLFLTLMALKIIPINISQYQTIIDIDFESMYTESISSSKKKISFDLHRWWPQRRWWPKYCNMKLKEISSI